MIFWDQLCDHHRYPTMTYDRYLEINYVIIPISTTPPRKDNAKAFVPPGCPPDISLSTGSTSMKYASNDATPKKIPQIIPRIAMNPQGRDAMAGVPDVPVSPWSPWNLRAATHQLQNNNINNDTNHDVHASQTMISLDCNSM